MIINGGMELFTGNLPNGWSTNNPAGVSHVTAQGLVHSGLSSVGLTDGTNLCQTVPIEGGCFYEFSFFAHGEGAQVAIDASVVFITGSTETLGLEISIPKLYLPNANRDFGYYRGITIKAPTHATSARVCFSVSANGGQTADIDDVSLSVS
jgi:hypothetical protein